jgi:DNA-binding NarL/FixJ family response regulator
VSDKPPRPGKALGPAPTRIVLIDVHSILRAGIRLLLETEGGFEVVGEAATPSEGLRVVRDTAAELVVTELALPGESRLTIEALRAASPKLRVIILTTYCTDDSLHAALSAGADGYLLKEASLAELLQAIRAVTAGQRYFSSPVSARLLSTYLAEGAAPARPLPITAREREVLIRIALGGSNKGTALAMHLSVKTVEKHRANLMRKLEVHNAAGMTLFALRNGLLSNAPPGGSLLPKIQVA